MKIVIAPDKFKNSLSAIEFCEIVENTIRTKLLNAEIVSLPLADGGDGSIDVIQHYIGGKMVECKVNNPLFRKIKAQYLWSEKSKTAFVEMAEASGLKLLQPEERNCMFTTTLGTGELIKDAILNKGAEKIILGIGGSATNDCGIGMAKALGYEFLDKSEKPIKPIGKNLIHIKHINATKVIPELNNVEVVIACDVNNPLYGRHGAAYVYGAQKGASPSEIEHLNKGLEHFSNMILEKYGVNPQEVEGAGAAGGMGIGSMIFLNAALNSGIEIIKNLAQFRKNVKDADWVITGEGSLDEQTLSGKVIQGVIHEAKQNHTKVATFSGRTLLSKEELKTFGVDYAASVMDYTTDLNDAMKNTKMYLKEMVAVFVEEIEKQSHHLSTKG